MRRSLLNKRITPKHLWQLFGLFTMLLLPSTAWGETPTSYNYLNWGPSERGIVANIDKGEVTITAEAQTVTYNAQQKRTVPKSRMPWQELLLMQAPIM